MVVVVVVVAVVYLFTPKCIKSYNPSTTAKQINKPQQITWYSNYLQGRYAQDRRLVGCPVYAGIYFEQTSQF